MDRRQGKAEGKSMGRTQKSLRNLIYGLVLQFVTVALSFVTRTCMIRFLGIEVVSINGLFHEVIAALSLAELGIGSAIVFNLYKPLAEHDRHKICQLMTLFRKAYMAIAAVILLAGTAICPWLQLFISGLNYDMDYLRLVYMLFVFQCASSYLFSYKAALLNADQKGYVSSRINIVSKIAGTVVLLTALFASRNYVLYLGLNILFTLATNIYLSHVVDRLHPYIRIREELPKEERKQIFANVKNIFVKQLAGKIVNSTDNLLISSLIGTVLVGIYGNYSTITYVFRQLADMMMQSVTSSMGNLFVSSDSSVCIITLKRLTYIFYLTAIIASVGTYASVQPFVSMWVGEEYLLNKSIVFILCLLLFVYILYKPLTVAMHMTGYFVIGRNISFVSAGVNLIVSIILGLKIGLIGIFIGTLCTYLIEVVSKIYYLFQRYFRQSAGGYVLMWGKMCGSFALMILIIEFLTRKISLSSEIMQFFCMGSLAVTLTVIYNLVLFGKSDEQKYLAGLAAGIIKRDREKRRKC